MNIIELDDPFPIDLTTAPDRTFHKLHLSTIYTDIEKKLFGGPRITDNPLWAQIGFLYERVLADCFQEKYPNIFRPGEVELDGITGSPDGIDLDCDPMYLEEYKCTWLSSKNTIQDMWKWKVQTMGYCKMLGLRDCRFRVLHMNGDYGRKTEYGPQYKSYIVNYAQSEIDENWDMILNHAKAMKWL